MLLKWPTATDTNMAAAQCKAVVSTPVRRDFPAAVTSWLITKETLLQKSVMENWSTRYVPVTKGVYMNELKGMPGEKLNPISEGNKCSDE